MNHTTYNPALAFDEVYQKLSAAPFLNKKDQSELPYYVQTYPIEKEEEVNAQIQLLVTRLQKQQIETLYVDLYSLCLEILNDEEVLDEVIKQEQEIDKKYLLDTLCNMLDPTVIIDKITQQIERKQPKLILFSHIAPLYPYIRSHDILNNLQGKTTGCPTILFYPGEYSNDRLILFDCVKEDNYYRAHNLSTINI